VTSCSCSAHNGFLTAKGLEQAALQTSLEGLEPLERSRVEQVGVSESALIEPVEPIFVDDLLDQQYRRFHNGV